MAKNEQEYHASRIRAETWLAEQAGDIRAKAAHLQLAELHRRHLAGRRFASTSADSSRGDFMLKEANRAT